MTQENDTSRKPTLTAYSIRESKGSNYWTKIGVAWSNKDGGVALQLDCIPLDGRIVCQPARKEDK